MRAGLDRSLPETSTARKNVWDLENLGRRFIFPVMLFVCYTAPQLRNSLRLLIYLIFCNKILSHGDLVSLLSPLPLQMLPLPLPAAARACVC